MFTDPPTHASAPQGRQIDVVLGCQPTYQGSDVCTAIVAASHDPQASQSVQQLLSANVFRVYTNDDVIGVELGGAVKNVVAIGSGVVRGLGMGTNTVAAIITRGLAEMTRLAVAQGARVETMAGLVA